MYCTVGDVIADFGGSITIAASGTKITTGDVDGFIASESNFIDSYLCAKYQMPVDENASPSSYDLLKRICIFRVSDRIRNIIQVKTGDDKTSQDTKGQSRKPLDDLDRILEGKLRLIDCPIATPDDGLAFGVRNECYKPFSLNKQQW